MNSGLRKTLLLLAATGALTLLFGCAEPQKTPSASEYTFWPPPPEQPRIQYLTTISTSADITRQQTQFENLIYGADPTGDLPFQRPYGVHMMDGKLYICDTTAGNVSILDFRKKEVRILGVGTEKHLLKPIDLAITPDGVKYVADTGQGAVLVYDENDKFAGRVAVKDMRPVSVAVQGGELFVSDIYASRIRVFDRFNGKELRQIGEPGGGEGKLGGSMGIALDAAGSVFVDDIVGCRVQKFTPEGKFVSALGGQGRSPGKFVRPKLLTVDSSGILYVVDNAFQNVQMFNDKGQMLMYFGGPGRYPGAMSMPAGVCVTDHDLDLFASFVHPAFDAQRLVIVTNNLGPNKINIYALGQLKPGKTVQDISANKAAFLGAFDTSSGPGALELTTLPDEATGPTTAPMTSPTTAPTTARTTAPATAPVTAPLTVPATPATKP